MTQNKPDYNIFARAVKFAAENPHFVKELVEKKLKKTKKDAGMEKKIKNCFENDGDVE